MCNIYLSCLPVCLVPSQSGWQLCLLLYRIQSVPQILYSYWLCRFLKTNPSDNYSQYTKIFSTILGFYSDWRTKECNKLHGRD